MLPLHYACARAAPLEIVKYMVEHYPQSANRPDPVNNKLPLLIACSHNNASVKVIQFLIQSTNSQTNIIKTLSPFGYWAWTMACKGQMASAEIVRILFQPRPSLTMARGRGDGTLPLHGMLNAKDSRSDYYRVLQCVFETGTKEALAVVQFLVSQEPALVHNLHAKKLRDRMGGTPRSVVEFWDFCSRRLIASDSMDFPSSLEELQLEIQHFEMQKEMDHERVDLLRQEICTLESVKGTLPRIADLLNETKRLESEMHEKKRRIDALYETRGLDSKTGETN